MNIDWGIVSKIAGSIILIVIGSWIKNFLERRPNLSAYFGNVSSFTLGGDTENPIAINFHSVVLMNAGKKQAKNVTLSHPFLPEYKIYPEIGHRINEIPGGGQEIIIPNLAPKQQITVSYLYYPPISWNQINGPIKSDEGMARVIPTMVVRQYPKWVKGIIAIVLLAGITSIIYVVIFGIRWVFLINNSPA